MSALTLDPAAIVRTLERLGARIGERFPDAGLGRVCGELTGIARLAAGRARRLEEPDLVLRGVAAGVIALGAGLIGALVATAHPRIGDPELLGLVGAVDAALSTLIVMGGAVWFLVTLETRARRRRALLYLEELRSVIHVIDMHQLTKDPGATLMRGRETRHSPQRPMSPFELMRYLDYCSEMLSLAAKVAALYAQSARDPAVIAVSSDLSHVTSDLNLKIWQKISLVQHDMARAESNAGGSGGGPPA